jgi:hypothetical protein
MTKAPMLSHLPSNPFATSSGPPAPKASIEAETVRSSIWREVTHSCERTVADKTPMQDSMTSSVRVFPVASWPWTTIVGGLGKRDYEVLAIRSENLCEHVHLGEQPTDVFESLDMV